MNIEVENKVSEIKHIISLLKEHANIDEARERLKKLTEATQTTNLWDD